MTTPAAEESSVVHFRSGQHWLDPQGRLWAILLATDQDRVETRQRGQTFSVWRPSTPPPGWRRLVDGRVPDLAVTPIHERRLS